MDSTRRIRSILDDYFASGPLSDCFVIDIVQNGPRALTVYFDSDSGVTLDKCTQVSRYLEKRVDEEQIFGSEYTLDVSSPGVDRPLKLWRQYPRHLGRYLEVFLQDGSRCTGQLKRVDMDEIALETETEETVQIPFSEIEKAFVQIRF